MLRGLSKKEKIGLLFSVIVLLIAIAMWTTSDVQVRFENGAMVRAEVVTKPLDVITGLMFREKLGKGKGMLFSHAYDDYHSIWMKNMKFPIDILWIDSSYRILWIVRNAKPCTREPCEIFVPPAKARYVLEVNANFADENNISIGQNVVISQPALF